MPMAGEGSRFASAGWSTPKPLIKLDGKELFRRAIDSVRLPGVPMKYSFIVRREHIDHYGIDRRIKEILPEARVYSVEKTTRGAVETCMVAAEGIDDADAVVVMDCDLEFVSARYGSLLLEAVRVDADHAVGGALVTFESTDPRYSYALADSDGRVLRTAEKEAISTHALCGAYFFGSGADFKRAAVALLGEPVMEKPEYYVSLLYNYLLRQGREVRLASMEVYRSYGTPEELRQYMPPE